MTRVSEIAAFLGGELRGEGGTEIRAVKGLEDSSEGSITYLRDAKLLDALRASSASCAVVAEFVDGLPMAQIRHPDPHMCFVRLLERMHPRPRWPEGVSERASVDKSAVLGEGVTVMPHAYVGANARIGRGTSVGPGVYVGIGVEVGEGCHIYPNVTLMEGTVVGHGVIIHAGTVIGSDGYGYIQRGGAHVKVPQTGGVLIGNDVEIGSNTSIDRATTGMTVIEKGVKIDNLVHIAHNCKIGEGTLLTAACAMAGSTTIGKGCMVGGNAGLADHINIEDGTAIGGMSMVIGDLKKGLYYGQPARPHREWLRAYGNLYKLDGLKKRLAEIEDKLKKYEDGRKGS